MCDVTTNLPVTDVYALSPFFMHRRNVGIGFVQYDVFLYLGDLIMLFFRPTTYLSPCTHLTRIGSGKIQDLNTSRCCRDDINKMKILASSSPTYYRAFLKFQINTFSF